MARGLPAPVRPRGAWFAFAITAVLGTIAAALLPTPWAIVCGVLAALGATGAFVMFVVIVVLEDSAVPNARAKPEDQLQGPKATTSGAAARRYGRAGVAITSGPCRERPRPPSGEVTAVWSAAAPEPRYRSSAMLVQGALAQSMPGDAITNSAGGPLMASG